MQMDVASHSSYMSDVCQTDSPRDLFTELVIPPGWLEIMTNEKQRTVYQVDISSGIPKVTQSAKIDFIGNTVTLHAGEDVQQRWECVQVQRHYFAKSPS